MKDWSIFEFSKFLYQSFGKPNNELKDKTLSIDLSEFKLKDFPPIENIRAEFIHLQTDAITQNVGSDKFEIKESRLFRAKQKF